MRRAGPVIFGGKLPRSNMAAHSSTAAATTVPKFEVLSQDGTARVGSFKGMDTPCVPLQTSFGSPAFLMRDVLASLPLEAVPAAAVRAQHMWGHDDAIAATGKDLGQYCNLGGRVTMLLMRDPSRPSAAVAGTTQDSLSIQTWYGRRSVSAHDYMRAIVVSSPDLAVSFHDEVPGSVGHNRTRTSLERSERWLAAAARGTWHGMGGAQDKATLTSYLPCKDKDGAAVAAAAASKTGLLAYVPCVPDNESRTGAVAKVVAVVEGREEEPKQQADSKQAAESTDAPDAASSAQPPKGKGKAKAAPEATGPAPPCPPFGIVGAYLGSLNLGESPQERQRIMEAVLHGKGKTASGGSGQYTSVLPSHLMRVLAGPCTPLEILDAVGMGCDVIDTDYAEVLTAHGYAAAFLYDDTAFPEGRGAGAGETAGSTTPATTGGAEGSAAHAGVKRTAAEAGLDTEATDAQAVDAGAAGPRASRPIKGFGGTVDAVTASRHAQALSGDATKLNLLDKRYALDKSPLVPSCGCFACAGRTALENAGVAFLPDGPDGSATGDLGASASTAGAGSTSNASQAPTLTLGPTKDGRPLVHPGHMRSYVHHLLVCHEMLGSVLLSVHNCYHLGRFMACVRRAIAQGRFQQYKDWFVKVNGLQQE